MGTSEFGARDGSASRPGGEQKTLLHVVILYYRNWDKLWPDGSPGSYVDLCTTCNIISLKKLTPLIHLI